MANDDAFRDRVRRRPPTTPARRCGRCRCRRSCAPSSTRRSPTSRTRASAEGGMLTAGLFLQEFVGEGIPWAHLDIAGPGVQRQGGRGDTRPRAAPASACAPCSPSRRRTRRGRPPAHVTDRGPVRIGRALSRSCVSRRSCGGTSAGWRWSRRRGRGRPWTASRVVGDVLATVGVLRSSASRNFFFMSSFGAEWPESLGVFDIVTPCLDLGAPGLAPVRRPASHRPAVLGQRVGAGCGAPAPPQALPRWREFHSRIRFG